MRVALITDGIWPYVLGGMQKHSYYLCKYLAQNKVYVDLFHFNRSNYEIGTLDVFTDKERKYVTSIIVDPPRSFWFPGHYLYNSYRHSKLIYNRLRDQVDRYDFIFAKGFTGWHLIEQKKKGNINCAPVAVKFHGYEMFQKPPDWRTRLQHIFLLRKPVREISSKADYVFSYGGKITEIIRSLGIKDSGIIEMPSGVEQSTLVTEIKKVDDRLKILYLGRYERRKGIEELNTAIRSILKTEKASRVQFNFIGPIPESKQLRSNQVHYSGEVRNKQKLLELVRANDILICPSWSEGMPNVILEAMAGGLAVIATDVGATNILVNEKTGWLLSDSSPQRIIDCLNRVMDASPGEIELKKAGALEHISRHFTWEKLISDLIFSLGDKGIQRVSSPPLS